MSDLVPMNSSNNLPALREQQVNDLISQAIDKNVSVETLQKLLDMRRELKAEFAEESFNQAMRNFQSQCPTIVKTKEVRTLNGKLMYKYAPIESIVAQVKGPIAECGFRFFVDTRTYEDRVQVLITVAHADGHRETTEVTLPIIESPRNSQGQPVQSKAQEVCATMTSAKRLK